MPTQDAIAKGLGIDPILVTRYKRQGMPIDSLEAARAWRAANIRPRAVSGSPAKKTAASKRAEPNGHARAKRPPPNPYQDARTRLAIAEAQDAELRLLERKGVLRHEGALRAELARRLSGLRDAILQMPSRLQAVAAAETDEAKVYDLIQDECFGVLAQIANLEAPPV